MNCAVRSTMLRWTQRRSPSAHKILYAKEERTVASNDTYLLGISQVEHTQQRFFLCGCAPKYCNNKVFIIATTHL